MKLGIMQPYIFPYLGYFQLINAVDTFIIYDDVTFIKQGWINRNHILLNGAKYQFTIPLQNTSSNALIKDSLVSDRPFDWEAKLLQTITNAYKKAPHFNMIFPMVESIIKGSKNKSISCVATNAIEAIMRLLSINTSLIKTSADYKNQHLKSEERIIALCHKESAVTYVNAIGGRELYNFSHFAENKINLCFIKPAMLAYKQFKNEFIASLSIIDTLMFVHPDVIKNELLPAYSLLCNQNL
jgi:hypothetical protein